MPRGYNFFLSPWEVFVLLQPAFFAFSVKWLLFIRASVSELWKGHNSPHHPRLSLFLFLSICFFVLLWTLQWSHSVLLKLRTEHHTIKFYFGSPASFFFFFFINLICYAIFRTFLFFSNFGCWLSSIIITSYIKWKQRQVNNLVFQQL